MSTFDLTGLTLLVVEDDALILTDLCGILESVGAVTKPAKNVRGALDACHDRLDVAILDIRLGDESVMPIVERLEDIGVPFIFHAANFSMLPDIGSLSDAIRLAKPASKTNLIESVMQSVKFN